MKFNSRTCKSFFSVIALRCSTLIQSALVGITLCAISVPASAHVLDETLGAQSSTATLEPSTVIAPLAAIAPTGTSAGCGRTGKHSTGLFKWTVKDGKNRTRSFLVEVPGDYDETKPYSLSFVFHGAGGSSSQSYSWGLQSAAGASASGIFVFPDGINYQNYGVGWDDASTGYDLPFYDNMVKTVETYFCVDKTRVFAAGFSWGGDFVTALVCNRGNAIRAVAINSSTDEYKQSSNYLTYQGMPCPTTIHPAVRFQHSLNGDAEYPAPYFSNTSKLMQNFNSCSAASAPVGTATTTMSCVSYKSCKVQYIECSFSSSIGHNLPPNWSKDTWAFFSTFH